MSLMLGKCLKLGQRDSTGRSYDACLAVGRVDFISGIVP